MAIKRLKRFDIARDLSITRAVVDSIKIFAGKIFLAVTYRKGRVFCCYNSDLELIFRLDEESLKERGLVSFRAMGVDSPGNLVICGSDEGKNLLVFTIDTLGALKNVENLGEFPLLMDMDLSGDYFYFHSPLKERPVCMYSRKNLEGRSAGAYLTGEDSLVGKTARVLVLAEGKFALIYESEPVTLCVYDAFGEEIVRKKLAEDINNPDHVVRVLDAAADEAGERIYLLMDDGIRDERSVRIVNIRGDILQTMELKGEFRRLGVLGGKIITSETLFGLWEIISSGKMYGTITTLDLFDL